MSGRSGGRRVSARPWVGCALLALLAYAGACGTKGDDTLGLSLIEDRGERKAVRFVSLTADSSISFQSPTAPMDAPTSPTLLLSGRPGYSSRALVLFGGLPPAGTVVDSARIVWPFRDAFGTSPFSLDVHRVTGGWTETLIAPDSFPAFDMMPSTSVDVEFTGGVLDTFTVDLGALVQTWVDSANVNLGIALVPAPGEDAELEIEARESTLPPRLVVHWRTATADTSVSLLPAADVFSLGTTPAFEPLAQPGRAGMSRGLAGRTLLSFPWTDPGPRSTIHRAELTLHLDLANSSFRSIVAGARRVTGEPWAGFDTPVDPELEGIHTVSPDADSTVFDVTDILVDLLSEENHGFEIRSVDERSDTDYVRFHAHDTEAPVLAPTLRVWWTPGDLPEDTP